MCCDLDILSVAEVLFLICAKENVQAALMIAA